MNLDKKVKTKNSGPIEQRAVKRTREIACSPKPCKQRKENTGKDKTCTLVDDIWTCNARMAIYGNPDDVRKLEAWNKCSECFNPFHDSFVCGIERDSR